MYSKAQQHSCHARQPNSKVVANLFGNGMHNFAAESKNRFFLAKPFQIFTNSS